MDRGAWPATVHGVAKEVDITYWLNNYNPCPSLPSISSHSEMFNVCLFYLDPAEYALLFCIYVLFFKWPCIIHQIFFHPITQHHVFRHSWASLVAHMIKNPPAMQETWVQSLRWEDPLEEGMATHSSILAWRIPMDRRAWQATVCRVTESDLTEQLSRHNVIYRVSLLFPILMY